MKLLDDVTTERKELFRFRKASKALISELKSTSTKKDEQIMLLKEKLASLSSLKSEHSKLKINSRLMTLKLEEQAKEISTLIEENEKLRIELAEMTTRYTEQIRSRDEPRAYKLEDKLAYSANGEEVAKLQETIRYLMEENEQLKERQELLQNNLESEDPLKPEAKVEEDRVIKHLVEENMTLKADYSEALANIEGLRKSKMLTQRLKECNEKVAKELMAIKERVVHMKGKSSRMSMKFRELGKWMADVNEKMIYKVVMHSRVQRRVQLRLESTIQLSIIAKKPLIAVAHLDVVTIPCKRVAPHNVLFLG
eukprot:TRINITY_DN3212_c0_g2_i1.p1 TRINITY_DN3212_c0_g2~~TRINITY_DN3212_c0_g2_i1.p1  ORF type:complete len:310 (+),score=104.07 TRINITY_DN3212_c0_g2_i1:313-1242(+)